MHTMYGIINTTASYRQFFILSGFFLLLIFACNVPKEPLDLEPGEHQCSYCKMGIVDMRFRAQVITNKGKFHYFDSIECLSAWSHTHHEKINSSWVGNFAKKGEWINRNQALILHSELKSPMGAGLSAYATQNQLSKAQNEFQGTILDRPSLDKYIQTWKNKNN